MTQLADHLFKPLSTQNVVIHNDDICEKCGRTYREHPGRDEYGDVENRKQRRARGRKHFDKRKT